MNFIGQKHFINWAGAAPVLTDHSLILALTDKRALPGIAIYLKLNVLDRSILPRVAMVT
jgi:hypothetical protein